MAETFFCSSCGAKVTKGDDFCSSCGEPIVDTVIKKGQKPVMSEADMMSLLDTLYAKCQDGIPKVSVPVSQMAEDYLKKNKDAKTAAKKCSTFRLLNVQHQVSCRDLVELLRYLLLYQLILEVFCMYRCE